MSFARVTTLVLAVSAFVTGSARGQAGPPLITDDPGTPGDGRWEINLALTIEQTRAERALELPLLDINYGLGDHIQLKYEGALLVVDEQDAGPRGTLSNSLVG